MVNTSELSVSITNSTLMVNNFTYTFPKVRF